MDPSHQDKDSRPQNDGMAARKKLHLTFLAAQLALLVAAAVFLLQDGNYGWTLFCIIPLSIGLSIGTYSATFKSRKLMKSVLLVILVLGGVSALLLAAGLEGAICVLMALGLIVLPALIGVSVGFLFRRWHRLLSLGAILVLNTSAYVHDRSADDGVSSIAEKSMLIHAPVGRVWGALTHEVAFSPGRGLLFRSGLSHPREMRLERDETGQCFLACDYRNGMTKMRIESLDSLRLMRFTIPQGITPMRELSFRETVDAPHLEGYFRPMFGEFELVPMPSGQCRLIARTGYAYKITPKFYWQWWTDYLINAMHRDVLEDIKAIAEGDAP